MARLLAAMSGGVDSSVAAATARDEGHDVVGVTLRQWDDPDEVVRPTKGCAVVDAVDDARRSADTIGIAHYVLDFREVFAREVIDPFAREYAEGRTPNPCVRCNERVRFGALMDKALRLGFDGLVTGHYARVRSDATGCAHLLRARNRAKDQSYVLYTLGQEALARVQFPIGEFESKEAVRERARETGLASDREESVEVCFVPPGRTAGDLVASRLPMAVRRGPIMDESGRVVGEHRGLAHYTIGQRKGLGAFGARRYVSRIDARRNAIVVSDAGNLESRGLEASHERWVSGMPPPDGTRVGACVRYAGAETPARIETVPGGFRLGFERPVRAVAAGQAVVLYRGDEVLGGGTIVRPL